MNTATVSSPVESRRIPTVENEDEAPDQRLTRVTIKRYMSVALVANMLSDALQKGFNKMNYTLILVADTGLLDFDAFLQGRADALMRMGTDLCGPLADAFPHEFLGEYAGVIHKGELPLGAETEIYRKLLGEMNTTPEKMQTAEATLSKVYELYAQVECFMRAVDSYGEDSPQIKRYSAPKFVPAFGARRSAA